MSKDPVLIEVRDAFVERARKLLLAADFEPIIRIPAHRQVHKILHQISPAAYRTRGAVRIDRAVERIQKEVRRTLERHQNRIIVFWAPDMPEEEYVTVLSTLSRRPWLSRPLNLTLTASDAVARFLHEDAAGSSGSAAESFVLDKVPRIDTLGDDLRDDATGRLDAKKVSELFKISLSRIAQAAGLTRQALDENPTSEKAQPLLRLFERVARLRAHPQIKDAGSLRKWFRKQLPLFSGRSAEELFQEHDLELVATKVDQLLTGDFGG